MKFRLGTKPPLALSIRNAKLLKLFSSDHLLFENELKCLKLYPKGNHKITKFSVLFKWQFVFLIPIDENNSFTVNF